MKALIIYGRVHSLLADGDVPADVDISRWNNGNPAPDALVDVPPAWEPHVDGTFGWSAENGLTEPSPGYVLERVKFERLAAFDKALVDLDRRKARPTASIAAALAAGDPVPAGDAYRLSELEAIVDENRLLRQKVCTAQTFTELDELAPWMP